MEKKSLKLLIVSDIHDNIENVKKLVELSKNTKYDYVFCCGDTVDLPIAKNDVKEISDKYTEILKNIYIELEKIAPIIWVPGNHEPGHCFHENFKDVTEKSKNLHKKIEKLDDKFYIVGLGGAVPILTGGKWKENYIFFKDLECERDFKYKGYPYNYEPNNYEKSDEMFIKDLNETIDKAKKESGDDVQILFLTHIGPLYTNTNVIVENGEVLYLGSKKFGEKYEKENNSFIIVHGHSHTAEGFITLKPNKYVMNPGALLSGNYAVLELIKREDNKWGVLASSICYL